MTGRTIRSPALILAAALLACAIALLAAPRGAEATFPGDNGRIAFSSDRDGDYEIYTVAPDGTGERRLTDNSSSRDLQPAWSPDGTKIAFARQLPGENTDVWVMNADGTGERRLTDSTAPDQYPAWSPDGTQIAFGCQYPKYPGDPIRREYEVCLMGADGTGVSQLTRNGRDTEDNDPDWGPDGGLIAYTLYQDGGPSRVVSRRVDGSEAKTKVAGRAIEPAFSPNGLRVAFRRGGFPTDRSGSESEGDIYVVGRDGSGLTNLTKSPAAHDAQPSWGPAG